MNRTGEMLPVLLSPLLAGIVAKLIGG